MSVPGMRSLSMPCTILFTCGHRNGASRRKGANGTLQLLRRAACGKYQHSHYRKRANAPDTDARIAALTKEGCGIRSTGRVLGISTTAVIKRIAA